MGLNGNQAQVSRPFHFAVPLDHAGLLWAVMFRGYDLDGHQIAVLGTPFIAFGDMHLVPITPVHRSQASADGLGFINAHQSTGTSGHQLHDPRLIGVISCGRDFCEYAIT